MPWQFWIDVGGTFTDCIGQAPDGRLHTCKILSSGIIKGTATQVTADSVIDPEKAGLSTRLFTGFQLSFLRNGELSSQRFTILDFNSDTGTLKLDFPLPEEFTPNTDYELSSGEKAPVMGIRQIMGLRLDEAIGNIRIRLGTTAGTNALLERKGATVAYMTTKGFGDLLEIGTQARPALFKLNIVKPKMLYRDALEIDERVDAEGNILTAISPSAVEAALRPLKHEGIDAIAICFLNALWNPKHEIIAADIASQLGFSQVSVSHKITPTIKMLNRGDTTVVDAYLSPVIRKYIASIRISIPDCELKLMTSAGGLVDADHFIGKDSILSGPAGGVSGFADVAQRAGFSKAIGFDMGGTSTDVSRFDGEFDYQFVSEKAGVRIVAPMYAIETVAAGGGSICYYNNQRLLLGPESAGANPGPACYGRGGPLTITDINVFNGKIDESYFPFPLRKDIITEKLEEIARQIETTENRKMTIAEIADGFTQVANLKMAAAIKRISSTKGYDPAEYTLVSFGGAGSQHACAVSRQLGIRSILLHPLAGILSAYGIGVAHLRRFADKTILKALTPENLKDIRLLFQALETELKSEILQEGIPESRIQPPVRYFDVRYQGEDAAISIRHSQKEASPSEIKSAFETLHRQLYGYIHEDRDIEISQIHCEVIGETPKPEMRFQQESAVNRSNKNTTALESQTITALFDGQPQTTRRIQRADIAAGEKIIGPAIISEAFSTILVDPGWVAEMTPTGNLILTDTIGQRRQQSGSTTRDPVRLELFNNHFTHIATQMGITLQKTALSVNVKERLDFSCAILDAEGDLVVNAPHIPVHLGAMSEAVKGLLNDNKDINPGDVFLSNDPNIGGSHLPDLTVITPVFDSAGKTLHFFSASRAHHAEIGGIRPGSAYPFAKHLGEEGVLFSNFKIIDQGKFLEAELYDALTAGQYPSRLPEENIADIRAAIAANHVGQRELHSLIDQYSWPVTSRYMAYIREAAAEKVRMVLKSFAGRQFRFRDEMDDGSAICISLQVSGERLQIDFSGSADVNRSNSLNANRAIVQSAIMYCLRCLIDEDIPLNSGVLAPVDLVLPEGMLNPPKHENIEKRAAVFGGNVEVSQRIVDVIFGALGIVAAGQGTMNNFIFGNEQFGYYETICGGSGAGPGYHGASATHVHMTNTRLTDVEIIEKRYPVRINRFQIRENSGGSGKWQGGNGIIREIEFLEAMAVSLLTQRRTRAPYGLNGGEPGNAGKNLLYRAGSNAAEELPSLAQIEIRKGDRIIICTPGGGGFG